MGRRNPQEKDAAIDFWFVCVVCVDTFLFPLGKCRSPWPGLENASKGALKNGRTYQNSPIEIDIILLDQVASKVMVPAAQV